jgi:hypothetical protein
MRSADHGRERNTQVMLRIVFALAAISPLALLQARPHLAPPWFDKNVAGVPAVVWLAAAWFALFVLACWIPVRGNSER